MIENPVIQVIARICKAPDISAAGIRELMQRLEMNEKSFALLMNASPKTVQMWASGITRPRNAARRLMQIIQLNPDCINVLVEDEDVLY